MSTVVPLRETTISLLDDPCGYLYALAGAAPGKTRRVIVGGAPVTILQSADAARHVLVDKVGLYLKNFASFMPLFGESRLTLDGRPWQRSQRQSQPAITRGTRLLPENLPALFDRFVDDLLAEAEAHAIDAATDRTTIGALFSTVLTLGPDAMGSDFPVLLRTAVRTCTRHAWDLEDDQAQDGDAEGRAALAAIHTRIGEAVDERRAMPSPPDDALTRLIAARDRGRPRVDLIGEIATLIVAGSDTTGAALGWALSILAEHPDFQERLRAEIAAVVADRALLREDAERVPLLAAFIDETLRMFPPVPILSRVALQSDEIHGHAVEAGERILVSVIGLHQDPALWPEPHRFQPRRHMSDTAAPRNQSFFAFAAGPRVCGGQSFARVELGIGLITLLRRCRLTTPAPQALAFEWGASMRRRGGQVLRAERL